MAYGHAERTLAAIRLLEAQTEELLISLGQLRPEQARGLQEAAEAACLPATSRCFPSHTRSRNFIREAASQLGSTE
jgi:hypothetical protein